MTQMNRQVKHASIFLLGLAAVFVALSMQGCGSNGVTGPEGPQGGAGQQGAAGAAGSTGAQGATGAPATTVDPAIQDIVSEYATQINPGINCTVQQVTTGQWLSASSPGYPSPAPAAGSASGTLVLAGSARPYTLTGGFNQPSSASGPNSVVGSEYQYLLTAWVNYKVTCSGFLILTQAGIYDFDVNSDDGAILSLSGLGSSYSLNDDGTHAMTDKATTTGSYLYPGVYSFSLQYAQSGGGNFGLIVSYILDSNESVIPGANFYH